MLGQVGQFNPNDPKWLKSNFLCVSVVSHPITSLWFTIATLVALIDPWRVWAPALPFLSCFAGLVHCSGIGCRLASISVWILLFRFWLAKLYHPRQFCVCVCGGDFTHTTIYIIYTWRYSPHLRQKCKARMIHTCSSRMFGDDLGPQLPQNSKFVNFRFLRTKTTPQIGRKSPQFARKSPQDKMYFIHFIAKKRQSCFKTANSFDLAEWLSHSQTHQ